VACSYESARGISKNSPLQIGPVATYETYSDYYHDLFLDINISRKQIKRDLVTYYRRIARYPKESNIVIDKAPNAHLVRTKTLKSAFAKAKFILIYRDPVVSIEGLQRKWELFRKTSIHELCDFWVSLHRIFLNDTNESHSDVLGIKYSHLVNNTEEELFKIVQFCGLEKREHIFKYSDRPNIYGKGLHHIVQGEIKIINNRNSKINETVESDKVKMIRKKTAALYQNMNELFY